MVTIKKILIGMTMVGAIAAASMASATTTYNNNPDKVKFGTQFSVSGWDGLSPGVLLVYKHIESGLKLVYSNVNNLNGNTGSKANRIGVAVHAGYRFLPYKKMFISTGLQAEYSRVKAHNPEGFDDNKSMGMYVSLGYHIMGGLDLIASESVVSYAMSKINADSGSSTGGATQKSLYCFGDSTVGIAYMFS